MALELELGLEVRAMALPRPGSEEVVISCATRVRATWWQPLDGLSPPPPATLCRTAAGEHCSLVAVAGVALNGAVVSPLWRASAAVVGSGEAKGQPCLCLIRGCSDNCLVHRV